MNIVITGTNRGIGLELCRLALKTGHQVCAVSRQPSRSPALQELKQEFASKLIILDLDVTSASAGETLVSALAGWPFVDLLINNAGILEQEFSIETMMKSFQVNSVAPLMLTQALLPLLKLSPEPKVAQITSRMGSIADAKSGGYYAYRASKAALNMLNKCLAVDNPWLTALVLHPGWVKTDMGGSSAPVEPKDSAAGLWKVIGQSKKQTDSGHFYDYQGQSIPW